MTRTVCLISTGQPSTNPRLVKEADALAEAGFEVHVICSHWGDWATPFDIDLLKNRSWKSYQCVGGSRSRGRMQYAWTRLRHRIARDAIRINFLPTSLLLTTALSRTAPDLIKAALRCRADIYIAHNLGALPAAVLSAEKWDAVAGFDAEDYHSGYNVNTKHSSFNIEEQTEDYYIRRCNYITASSPGIADEYQKKYKIHPIQTILNVFELRDRPEQLEPNRAGSCLSLYWFSQTIGEGRGLEDIVNAMALAESSIELHLRGNWQPGYQRQLMALAERLGLNDNIKYHAAASPSEMVRLATVHDVGLALEPPISQNADLCLSNKIFTYLLAGNAIIGTRTTGQSKILNEIGEAGFSYEAGDILTLSSHLRDLASNPEKLRRARSHSWALGAETFNWDKEKTKFIHAVYAALKTPD